MKERDIKKSEGEKNLFFQRILMKAISNTKSHINDKMTKLNTIIFILFFFHYFNNDKREISMRKRRFSSAR